MKRIVYYDEDPDGWMSAAILIDSYPDIELQELSKSNTEFNLVSGYDEVYVVDHNLREEKNLKTLSTQNKQVIWIDHHESAIQTYDNSYKGIRDETKAACILTWQFIHKDEKVPPAVFHIHDRDLWNFENDKTHIFSNYLESVEKNDILQVLQKLIHKEDLSEEYRFGEIVEKYKKGILDQMYLCGIKREFAGHKAMVFDGDALRSELMHIALQKNPDIDISVVKRTAFFKDGKEFFKYSLRSRKGGDIYVNTISKQFDGGGHYYASGFVTDKRV